MKEPKVERPSYGDARRPWHPDFVEYMYRIVEDPQFAGMPCTVDDDGKIDWTIPSNRSEGSKNWDGNQRRRDWWRMKADERGIPVEGKWLSRTAKMIHPFGEKPCQTCGRLMTLAYAYPTPRTVDRLNGLLPDDALLEPSDLLDVYEVYDHFTHELGPERASRAFAETFPALGTLSGADAAELKALIVTRLVKSEPRGVLSPGAMSNAPDRLDGFHTYNLCCRGSHDTGRTTANLKTYGADRRAFEHWCEGDWSAANYLMTQPGIGQCPRPNCENAGQQIQLTADHIGPISLGFAHSPHFDAVCLACNSSKNNRMSLSDVQRLLELEEQGVQVVSWQGQPLWDLCKSSVKTDEEALLLSKLLRINQHHFLMLLHRANEHGVPDALLHLLHPEFAAFRTTFEELDPLTLRYGRIIRTPRQATYANSHGARMVRIAFEALDDYASKAKRNVQVVDSDLLKDAHAVVDVALARATSEPSSWRQPLREVLDLNGGEQDARLTALFGGNYQPDQDYSYVREAFVRYLADLADILARRFRDGRAISTGDALDEAKRLPG